MSNTYGINLSGQTLQLYERECLELKQLGDMPGWDILIRCLDEIEKGTRDGLEDVDTPLEHIRALQGRLGVAKDLTKIVRELMPQVLQAMAAGEETDNA
jgi:hypothetical protein